MKKLFFLLVFGFLAGSLMGQNYQGYLLVTLGKDTVGIEKFTIKGNEVRSEAVRRVNQISKHSANITYREDGTISEMETYDYNASDSLISHYLTRSAGDSLFSEWEGNGSKNTWTVEGRPHLLGAQIPYFATYARFVQSYEKAPAADFEFRAIKSEPLIVKKTGDHEYALTTEIARTINVSVNSSVELEKVSALGTGLLSYEATRTDEQVYNSMAQKWLNDPQTKIISTVSPRIQEAFTVHGTEMKIDYSRTSKRGRLIFGGLVPFGKIWRTGSNLATHITFQNDVIFSGRRIPKGQYTLFTIPQPDQWILLLNKQTGQWGSYYDPSREALRMPMTTSYQQPESEMLTIEMIENGEGGEIIIQWDRAKASVPFLVSQ